MFKFDSMYSKTGNGVVIRYCQHCNTDFVGTFDLDLIDCKTTEKNKRKEILKFFNLKQCPICGLEFSEGKGYNFCNIYLRYLGEDGIGYDTNVESSGKTNYGFYYIREMLAIKYDRFADSSVSTLAKGERIMTEYGEGTVNAQHAHNSRVQVKFYDNIESMLSYLKQFRTEAENNEINSKFEKFIEKCDSKSRNTLVNNVTIKDDFNLKKYLENLLVIEKNIFSITKRLKELYFLDFWMEKDAFASEKLAILDYVNASKKSLFAYETLKKKNVLNEIKIDDFKITYPKEPQKPKEPNKPVLAKPGFFNKKRILGENAVLTEKYEKELEAYNLATKQYELDLKNHYEMKSLLDRQRLENYNTAIEKAKEKLATDIAVAKENYENSLKIQEEVELGAKDIHTPEKAKHQLLKDEIETAEELLGKFYEAKSEMYSFGIIFEKYRNFVAVSSFYEYIAAGRCETLEGTNGAYNLYENEIRMNMVIGQLNLIIESLEEIKQNQYMIYSAIQETNSQLSKLNSSMNSVIESLSSISTDTMEMKSYISKIAENTQVIAYNTEKTAFYAKKNAELTNALGFMLALR